MKVIVFAGGGTERSLIQTALDKAHHQLVLGEISQDVVRLLKSGQGRVVIADEDSLGMPTADFIQLLRAPDLPATYILILTSGEKDLVDSDDLLKKPFSVSDLRARILVAERFLTLGDRLSRANQQLKSMALYDERTGLMNQAAFLRTAHGELERARRASAPLSVLALEIDDFASVPNGEQILGPVAQIIREKSRPYDCIGRWADGQFVIALPNVIGEDAKKIAERILKGIHAEPLTVGERARTITAHAGVTAVLRITAATELEPLIEQAQQAIPRGAPSGGDDVVLTHA